jgi:hypothetical protein
MTNQNLWRFHFFNIIFNSSSRNTYFLCYFLSSIVLPKAANSVNADMMSVTQIHQKLEKGYADIEKGNVEDAASAFVAFRERH